MMLFFGNGRFDDGLEEPLKNVAIGNSEAKNKFYHKKGTTMFYIFLEVLEWK
jgi:hypothetical protein